MCVALYDCDICTTRANNCNNHITLIISTRYVNNVYYTLLINNVKTLHNALYLIAYCVNRCYITRYKRCIFNALRYAYFMLRVFTQRV